MISKNKIFVDENGRLWQDSLPLLPDTTMNCYLVRAELEARLNEDNLQDVLSEIKILKLENEELRGIAAKWNAELADEFPPTKTGCPFPVFVARLIKSGASYDAKSGIWYSNESKPGILEQRDAEIARLRKEVQEAKNLLVAIQDSIIDDEALLEINEFLTS